MAGATRLGAVLLFGGAVILLCLAVQSRHGESRPSALFYKASGLTWAERDAIAKVGLRSPLRAILL